MAGSYCQLARIFASRNIMLDPTSADTLPERENNARQAINNYQQALETLKARKRSDELWDAARRELAETYCSTAISLQRTLPLATEPQVVARTVADMLRGALDVYEEVLSRHGADHAVETAETRLRCAAVHHRLGLLHVQCARLVGSTKDETPDGATLPPLTTLAVSHFEKAAALYEDAPLEYIKVQVDQACALREMASGKTQLLERALDCLMNVRRAYAMDATHSGAAAALTEAARSLNAHGLDTFGSPAREPHAPSSSGAAESSPSKGTPPRGGGLVASTWPGIESELHAVLLQLLQSSAGASERRVETLKMLYRVALTEREHMGALPLLSRLNEIRGS